jgi:hypothetical protein
MAWMKEVLANLAPVAGIMVSLFAAVRYFEWSRANRLRSRIKRDLELLEKLNATTCPNAHMLAHIQRELVFLARTSRDQEMVYQWRMTPAGFTDHIPLAIGFVALASGFVGLLEAVSPTLSSPNSVTWLGQLELGVASAALVALAFATISMYSLRIGRIQAEKRERELGTAGAAPAATNRDESVTDTPATP